jgi:hypothetical protein
VSAGLAKTRFFFKPNQGGFFGFYWVFLGGFIGFFNFRPIKSVFLPVYVLFNYLTGDELKIK